MESFVGNICLFAFDFAPEGWITCQGQVLTVQQYQMAFALLSTRYGGDGRTTFGIPNLSGRLPLGMGSLGGFNYPIGSVGGAAAVTLAQTQVPLPAHTHSASIAANQSVAINIPAVSGSNGTTNVPGNTVNLSNSNTADRAPLPINVYSNATTNATLKPFNAALPTGAGTVTVSPNAPSAPTAPVSLMNPYLVLNFCMCLNGLWPNRP